MRNVGYRVTIGGTTLDPGDASPLVSLRVDTALGVPVNGCRLSLHGAADLSAQPGDPVTVELGYDRTLERVFTGELASASRGLAHQEVEALGSFSLLTATRLHLLFESETAGGIVKDVLGKAGVKEGKVEAGPKFSSFVVAAERSAWAELRALADRCGFDLFADEQDRAQFRAYAPAKTHTLAYGVDILEHERDLRAPAFVGVEVFGASPAGQGQGDDASSWLTKKDVRGTAGETSGRVLRVVDASARSQGLAGDVAAGLLAEHQRRARGTVRVLGSAAIRLGDAVKLEKLPVAAHNGEFRVTAVRHRLGPRTGFVTTVAWEER